MATARPARRKISANTAARKLSDILDAAEHDGEEFVIERHGRVIAKISPASLLPARRVTWGEFLARLGNLRPDPDFARDVRKARREVNKAPRDPWARS